MCAVCASDRAKQERIAALVEEASELKAMMVRTTPSYTCHSTVLVQDNSLFTVFQCTYLADTLLQLLSS